MMVMMIMIMNDDNDDDTDDSDDDIIITSLNINSLTIDVLTDKHRSKRYKEISPGVTI